MLVALFAGGHILLEGPPGTAKTLLAHSFAEAVGLDYGRIQFTPDLMPADIIGANLFNFQTSSFTLTRGPIFTELLLADEINRTPPKTQAALLEAILLYHCLQLSLQKFVYTGYLSGCAKKLHALTGLYLPAD